MSVEAAMARIAEINGMLAPAQAMPPATTAAPSSATAFQSALTAAGAGPIASAAVMPQGGSAGQKMVALAQAEVGQAEQPPGSNDSPRIAQYRSATAGSGVGPWCAYFVSWAAQQAGTPLGEQGQGFGSVSAVMDWGQRTGRALPAGSTPQPGDLIVWGGRHIGMVESVDADGSIHTIEGNSSDQVSRRTYGRDGGGATGYVRVG
jgi:hypothetical protein